MAMIQVECAVEFEVYCSCGRELKQLGRGASELTVEPCEDCLESACEELEDQIADIKKES